MREIKFRAWHKHLKAMMEWIYKPYEAHWVFSWKEYIAYWGDEDIIKLEWTGLQDNNKVDIYEGDIVEITNVDSEDFTITDVRFIQGGFVVEWDNGFHGGESDLTTVGWAIEDENAINVIGNIYQNPELLKSTT